MTTVGGVLFYMRGQTKLKIRQTQLWYHIPALLALGIGVSYRQTLATFCGIVTRGGIFSRTPKSGNITNHAPIRTNNFDTRPKLHIIEGLMSFYLVISLHFALANQLYAAVPFVLLFCIGFAFVFFLSLREFLAYTYEHSRHTARA